jgi:hypothetical protein
MTNAIKIPRFALTIAFTLICTVLACPSAFGAQTFLTSPIDQLQFDSHTRIGYEDVVWVYMAGT